jgi:P-type Ca2+ transporter type 2C
LLVFSKKTGIEEDEEFNEIQTIDDLPFNSEQKFRATLVKYPENRKEIMVVGAPEKLLDLSTKVLSADNGKDMTDETRDKIKGKIDEFTKNAMRVLACAFIEADKEKESVSPEDIENLVFAGLFGIIDPPRPEIKEAVANCNSAGIRVIMVTGDHKQTAAAIAREVGILSDEQKDSDTPEVLTENDLDVDDETFSKYTAQVNVFARVSPQAKLRIAESIQKKNQLIGMTGDGVNDAPALKTADLGIAMGQRGTDVAKDASQIVLSDDNFASIVNAIKEGRIVFRNIKITSFFLITTNVAQATTIVTAIAIGFTYPLLPTQILWINLITDGIMDISLATEPDHHGDIMKEKPKKKGAPILNKEIFPFLFIIAPVMVVLALLTFNHYLPQGVEKARTGVFLIIAMMQIFNAFNMRSLKHSAFKIGIFKNKWVNIAFIVSVVLQLAAIKVSFIQDIFHFRDLAWLDIAVITALSSLIFVAGELYKLIRNKIKNDKM